MLLFYTHASKSKALNPEVLQQNSSLLPSDFGYKNSTATKETLRGSLVKMLRVNEQFSHICTPNRIKTELFFNVFLIYLTSFSCLNVFLWCHQCERL